MWRTRQFRGTLSTTCRAPHRQRVRIHSDRLVAPAVAAPSSLSRPHWGHRKDFARVASTAAIGRPRSNDWRRTDARPDAHRQIERRLEPLNVVVYEPHQFALEKERIDLASDLIQQLLSLRLPRKTAALHMRSIDRQ